LHYFKPTYTFTLKNYSFLAKFLPLQNLKVAIYKGLGVSGRLKKAKKNVVIADFSKIQASKKALSVRLNGIPEEVLKPL